MSCAAVNVLEKETSPCPPPRYADEKVAEELANVPFTGFEDFWQWMSDIEELNDQLVECRK